MSTEAEVMDSGLQQEMISDIEGERVVTPGISEYARKSAAEGCVLLKNEGILPVKQGQKVSLFGRSQVDTFFVGYGSGGDVHPPYQVTILEGLRNCEEIEVNEILAKQYEAWCQQPEHVADPGKEWGKWPYFYPEMPLSESVVEQAAKESEIAIVVIGRAAGEERENFLGEGSYYLTEEEKRMLSLVTERFENTVLIMNCGNIIDMSFTKDYALGAILMMWLGGMEAGNALADVLCGRENPSGKLADTVAVEYAAYPSAKNFGNPDYNHYQEDIFVGYRYFETFAREKILYAFGYGLSYTTFDIVPLSYSSTNDYVEMSVSITNTGKRAGKEVVPLFVEAPQGKMLREKRKLLAFKKTGLLAPGKSEDMVFRIYYTELACFDDTGKTGHKSAYVVEPGEYWYFFGVSEPSGKLVFRNAGGSFVRELKVVKEVEEICPVQEEFERLIPVCQDGKLIPGTEPVPKSTVDMRARILEGLPEEIPVTGDMGYTFEDVCEGTATLEEFIAQLTDEELEALTRGEGGMNRPSGVGGNTGVFGGVIPSLREKGVPVIVTADGPAGLRIKRYTSLIPCGTALACTWNEKLVEQLFEKLALELERFDVDIMLSPGLNIHRNPLCGRNFEYYSEDPLISGKMAAAAVRGLQSKGASACPKHFACNNQEINRHHNDSIVSGRALREIYLRGFEICLKESNPKNLMMSYNKVNGVWSHYNYDLAMTLLRKEWGYEGVIMTDWWMQYAPSPEFPNIRDNAYRVRAAVDVLMPGSKGGLQGEKEYVSDGTLLETLGEPDGITRAELQRTARSVLKFAAKRNKN